jgi:hypothetical protein
MAAALMRRTVIGAVVALVVGAAGCSGQPSPEPSVEPSISESTPSATEASAPDDSGRRYALPEKMCDKVDVTALKDLYPEEEPEDQHLLNSERSCATALIAGPGRVLSLTVEVFLTPDRLMEFPELIRDFYDNELTSAPTTPTNIDGVGTEAAWYGSEHEVTLITFDGNANLKIIAWTVNNTHPLPDDIPERLGQVAAATLASLAV